MLRHDWWFKTGAVVLLVARLLAARYAVIDDCDETFNYWEPIHLQSYGRPALQTWEYSPQYGLRSYVYTSIYATIAHIFSLIPGFTKPMVFYAVRACNAAFCASCEYRFSKMIRSMWGQATAALYLWLSIVLPGMFQASPAVLPSQFFMCCFMLANYLHFKKHDFGCILVSLFGAFATAWPFASAIYLVMVPSVIYTRGIFYTISRGLLGLAMVCGLIIAVDYHYYGKLVFAPLNIALYNFGFSVRNLSQLYGVEPWYYYILNGLLNFNLCFPASYLSLWYFADHKIGRWLPIGLPMVFWFVVMSKLAHKEERFLYPIYPCIVACAAVFLESAYPSYAFKQSKHLTCTTKLRRYGIKAAVVAVLLLSASRIAALRLYYGGPAKVWEKSYDIIARQPEAVVCMGDDWYRSYSHFFMPQGARLEFTKAGFHGQLPRHFTTTSEIHPEFNDMNKEELSTYRDPSACDFFVGEQSPVEFTKKLVCEPMLDAGASRSPQRSMYIPLYSYKGLAFKDFCLWSREQS